MAYFYCSFSDQETQDMRTMVASILAQLCNLCPVFHEKVKQHYHANTRRDVHRVGHMTLQEGLNILRQGGDRLTGAYFFLDAINESQKSRKVLNLITDLMEHIPSVRIMFSSTEEIDNIFENRHCELVTMEQGSMSHDIHLYINQWLESNPFLSYLSDSLKARIISTLDRGHHGVYVTFSFEGRFNTCFQIQMGPLPTGGFSEKRTAKDIYDALLDVPKTLGETYRSILLRIPVEDTHTARKMLFWISSAVKPMTLKDLCEAVIIDDGNLIVNEQVRLLNPKGALELCGSLITYDNSSTRVTLAPSSVLDYLTSHDTRKSDVYPFFMSSEEMFQAVPRRCLHYLLMPAFKSGCCSNKTELGERLKEWPLLTYIADTLFHHLKYAKLRDPSFRDLVLRFFAT